MAGRYSAKRCNAKTGSGRCKAYAVKGSSRCIFHRGKATKTQYKANVRKRLLIDRRVAAYRRRRQ